MANTIQIKCINKRDRGDIHERIINVGGYTDKPWKITEDRAIELIESGEWKFYVAQGGNSVWVIVATRKGRKYLKTQADGEHENNLLSLPECP